MSDAPTTVPDRLHHESVAWLFSALDESERPQFYAGIRDIMHDAIDTFVTTEVDRDAGERTIERMFHYIESWIISLQLYRDLDWREQVAHTAKEWATDTHESAVTGPELRALLGV